jgi:hypothetical protein
MKIDLKKLDTDGDKILSTIELAQFLIDNPLSKTELKSLKENPSCIQTEFSKKLKDCGLELENGAIDFAVLLADNNLLPHPIQNYKNITPKYR